MTDEWRSVDNPAYLVNFTKVERQADAPF